MPARCKRLGAGEPLALVECLAFAQQQQGCLGHRSQIAAGADRALLLITGVTPLLSISIMARGISSRQPELPCACTLMRPAQAARTTSIGIGSPIPAAWL